MKCPYCNKEIHFQFYVSKAIENENAKPKSRGWDVGIGMCPACKEPIVLMRIGTYRFDNKLNKTIEERIIWPQGASGNKLPEEVPDQFRSEYREASSLLNISPKASAAISRRLLQSVIREQYGIKKRSLDKEIEALLNLDIPSYLSEAIDAVRIIGNFAAHPIKNKHTGEITDVENGEAEWLLEVLEALLDFTFIQPIRSEERILRLNKKLAEIGKPLLKKGKKSKREKK